MVGDLDGERAGVEEFMAVQTGKRTAGDVADHIAASSLGRQANGGEGVYHFDERFQGEPMELDVLAGGDVGEVAGVLAGDAADDPELVGGEDAVGKADAHHEELSGLALAADATGRADAVALGVNAPPLKVESCPLRQDGASALAGEGAYLVPGVPGVLGELQPLGALGFGFLDFLDWGSGGCFGHRLRVLYDGGLNKKAHLGEWAAQGSVSS